MFDELLESNCFCALSPLTRIHSTRSIMSRWIIRHQKEGNSWKSQIAWRLLKILKIPKNVSEDQNCCKIKLRLFSSCKAFEQESCMITFSTNFWGKFPEAVHGSSQMMLCGIKTSHLQSRWSKTRDETSETWTWKCFFGIPVHRQCIGSIGDKVDKLSISFPAPMYGNFRKGENLNPSDWAIFFRFEALASLHA